MRAGDALGRPFFEENRMAVKREFTYASADGRTKLHGVEWRPETGRPKAILQIFHGMVEYIERYGEFASYLTEKGFLVVGNDIWATAAPSWRKRTGDISRRRTVTGFCCGM